MRKAILVLSLFALLPTVVSATTYSQCQDIKEREACLENPNCNWDEGSHTCVDIQFLLQQIDCADGQCPWQSR